MGFEELKSRYYIHNGYLVFDGGTAYRVDTIHEVYIKGSFIFVTFKDYSFINRMVDTLDVDTIDFIQGLNKEIQHSHKVNKLVSVDFIVFFLLVIITLMLGIWWLLQ
jgi:hypothetical protein